jgi:hypothetical protein
VVFPVLIILKSLYIVLPIIRKTPYDQEMYHYAKGVTGDLYINIVPEQPVTVEKDGDDQHTKGLIEIQGIPENISVRRFQLIL